MIKTYKFFGIFIVYMFIIFSAISLYASPIVVYPENYPPYYTKGRDGKTSGFELDVIKMLEKRTGMHFTYIQVNNQNIAFDMIRDGKAQIMPGGSISPERQDYAFFSVPIETTDISIITLKNSKIDSLSDLTGKRAMANSQSVACGMLKKDPSIISTCVDDTADMVFQLFSGNVDATILPYDSISELLDNMNISDKIRVVSPPLYKVNRSIAVSKAYPELYAKLNHALETYSKTDQYKRLYKKWHPARQHFISINTKLHIVVICFITTLLVLLIWRYLSLRKINIGLTSLNKKLIGTQKALTDAETRFSAMAETINDIIWFTDAKVSKILYINKAFEKIYGLPIEDIYADTNAHIQCVHPDDLPKLTLQHKKITAPQTNTKFRIINKKTGKVVWVLSQFYPYRNEQGEILFIVGLVSDITQMVEAEQKMAVDRQVIAQQSKFASLGEMVGAITHQWRQPLNGLYLSVQLLEDMCDDENLDKDAIKENLAECMNIIEHMSETIDDFKDFFKQNKKQELFDAPQTVLQVMRMLSPQLRSNNINYHISCRCSLRTFSCVNNFNPGNSECKNLVFGIRNEFKHAILNLIQNAKDAIVINKCDQKNIDINMAVEKDKLFISVTDSAGGIQKDIIDKVFDAYVTAKKDGTGMGLYLAKKIIEENMGGTITAENTESGAKFTITLPVAALSEKPEHE